MTKELQTHLRTLKQLLNSGFSDPASAQKLVVCVHALENAILAQPVAVEDTAAIKTLEAEVKSLNEILERQREYIERLEGELTAPAAPKKTTKKKSDPKPDDTAE